MSTTDTDDTVLAPKLTDTLVPTTEETQIEEQKREDDTGIIQRMIPRQIMIQMICWIILCKKRFLIFKVVRSTVYNLYVHEKVVYSLHILHGI